MRRPGKGQPDRHCPKRQAPGHLPGEGTQMLNKAGFEPGQSLLGLERCCMLSQLNHSGGLCGRPSGGLHGFGLRARPPRALKLAIKIEANGKPDQCEHTHVGARGGLAKDLGRENEQQGWHGIKQHGDKGIG